MAYIGWGKPRVLFKDLDDSSATWQEMPPIVENSTELTTTKGDKKEAKVEGGENEDVKYNKNTYALACQVRAAKDRKCPIAHIDGVVAHNFLVVVQPEDPDVQGLCILKSAVSVEDAFTSEDGGAWTFTFDAVKKSAGLKQIYWGVIGITETGSTISSVTCQPEGADSAWDVEKGPDAA